MIERAIRRGDKRRLATRTLLAFGSLGVWAIGWAVDQVIERMKTPFRTTRFVEFHDTDMAGIMHFSSYFVYMESAEHELLRDLELSVFSTIDGQSVSFPRVSASCDFHAPVKCEDVLDIEVRVERVGEKSVTYEFRFTHNGRDIATGRMTCVCCHVEHGKPPISIPIPSAVADKLRQMVVQ